MLYCPNPICQTPNPETHRFCQKCRTPLLRRYLWAVGTMASAYQAGDVLGDRFLCKGSRIFLDSKPGLSPVNFAEVPAPLLPYLRLCAYPLHLPQIYDLLQFEAVTEYTPENTLLLLDQVPLYRPDSLPDSASIAAELSDSPDREVLLFPSLSQMWQTATPFRQLHWLWQIAQLWQPLTQEQCASTLLNPDLLRVEGGLLRVIELQSDRPTPTLADLGQLWTNWIATARSEIQGFLQSLCQQIISGDLHNTEQIVSQLDWAIAQVAQSQTYRLQIATRTDQGPTRPRNEDACYPASGTELPKAAPPLVIVCDGIGGHQGGDVASHLAIEAVSQRILALQPETLDPATLTIELEKAACLANDLISERNDSEQRFDRQRMGTTIVIALVRHHEIYLAHIGDSRAYWITRWGCHQITVDDDIASREVRLGYSTYRQALQQPSAGALVQALGMVGSSMLYPTVQRFLLDEDSVFLLCSDGLCDNDRVEEVWDTEILPVLDGKTNLQTVSRNLIDVGNTRNGYDNVTVGLLSCQVAQKSAVPVVGEYPGDRLAATPNREAGQSGTPTQAVAPVQLFPTPPTQPVSEPPPLPQATAKATAKTRIIPRKSSRPRVLPWIVVLAILSGLGVALYPLLQEAFGDRLTADNPEPSPTPSIAAAVTPTSLTVNTLLRIRPLTPAQPAPSTPIAESPKPLILQSRPAAPIPPPISPSPLLSTPPLPAPSESIGSIPEGSILSVLKKQGTTSADQWVQLRVCSVPITVLPPNQASNPASSPASSPQTSSPTADPLAATGNGVQVIAAPPPVQPGQEGWLREADLLPIAALDVPPDRADCPPAADPNLSPSPSPSPSP